ncbi:MAG: CDGSH iron-sulfur domain-containing protein [Desulfurococcales archaeon]|nr:CDGSH iron-sulfur domain-containing protein [Desulfurococcales archaeon]
MPRIRIIATRNGPLLVEVDGQVKTALCRCGGSRNKPYCDGTHAKIGFKADEAVAFEA